MSIAWEPPDFEIQEFFPKRTTYCWIVVVLNEGDRLRSQLDRMRAYASLSDIVIADGRSTDGSTNPDFLRAMGVRALLSTDEKGLSTATRMGLAYAIEQEYGGVVTIDGNGKDGVEALPTFLAKLTEGVDLVQGSRFMKGGVHKNTPLERYVGIRYVAAPILAMGCGYWYSDSTNAFRAMSMRFLTDARVQPIRKLFVRFNLQLYLIHRAAKLGFCVTQIPVRRVYPDDGSVPTKIIGWRPKLLNFWELLKTAMGRYDPR